jgi:hypothetical protein
MHPILKTVIAIFIGIVIALCVILLTESVASGYFPSPTANPTIAEIEANIRTAPLAAMLIFLAGHALSSFFGAYAAARIAPENKKFMSGITVSFFILLGGIVNFVSITHPLWLVVAVCISYIVFSMIAIYIARRGKLV